MARWCVAVLLTSVVAFARAQEAKVDSLGREYFVYPPARIDKGKTYWLVVGVHGYGGNGRGAAGLADWARRGDCIVVGPSFPNEGYQLLHQQADEQLEKLFGDLSKQFSLQPKMFLFGFSGGAQFAHRFMMKHPTLVAGCAAHSGGSWATGEQWGSINPEAAAIPLVISCGTNDTGKMHAQAPFGRLDWCREFAKQLDEKRFLFQADYWPNTGHQYSAGAQKMTLECFTLATQTLPQFHKTLESIEKLIADNKLPAAQAAIKKARPVISKAGSALQQNAGKWMNTQLDALSQKAR